MTIATILSPPMSPPWPLVITQRFGHPSPFPPHAPHTGMDVEAAVGRPIRAVDDGQIVHYFRAGHPDGPAADGTAICLLLAHAPSGVQLRCWYLHLSRSDVIVGSVVKRGDVLGATGDTGEVTGPHLHVQLEALVAGVWTPVDPLPWFATVNLFEG